MKCKEASELLANKDENGIPETQLKHLEDHLQQCSDCRKNSVFLEQFKEVCNSSEESYKAFQKCAQALFSQEEEEEIAEDTMVILKEISAQVEVEEKVFLRDGQNDFVEKQKEVVTSVYSNKWFFPRMVAICLVFIVVTLVGIIVGIEKKTLSIKILPVAIQKTYADLKEKTIVTYYNGENAHQRLLKEELKKFNVLYLQEEAKVRKSPIKIKEARKKLGQFVRDHKNSPNKQQLLTYAKNKVKTLNEVVESYLKKEIKKLLKSSNFNKAVELLKPFEKSKRLGTTVSALKKDIEKTSKERAQWFIDSARKWSANGDFKRSLSFLNIANTEFLTLMIESLTAEKKTILKYFVKETIENGQYQKATELLLKFLKTPNNHDNLQTKLYLQRLVHHHILSFTKKNDYSETLGALKALEQYKNIQIPEVKDLVKQLTRDVKFEQRAWYYLIKGIPSYRGKSVDIVKDSTKVTVIGPITFNIQNLARKGEFDIGGRIFFIRDLWLNTTLKKVIELGQKKSPKRLRFREKRNLYFALALYLFSQERFKDAQFYFTALPGYYEKKMYFYQK